MSIRQLPEDVIGQLKSSATITSLNAAVIGLLENALDAGATKVAIYVDYGRGNCTVEDNGLGISPNEFAEDGGLGKPHYTSKFPPSANAHGRRGAFIACLGVLSLLKLTSHHYRFNSHSTISIHHGKVLKRQTPSPPEERFQSFDHGTRAAVHDLFGSMPVRVKHRATLFADRFGVDKAMRCLIYDAVGLLLGWPSNVSVFLSETKWKHELRLKPPANTDMIARTSVLFTQASLADSGDAESWIPVSASSKYITLRGCISLSPVATRRSQFMSFGITPIQNEYKNNVLYEEVNKAFQSSSFGFIESENDNRHNGDMNTETQPRARKGIDRWPMFYFRVLLKGGDGCFDVEDILSHPRKDFEAITNLLKVISYGFLKKHHLRPHKIKLPSNKIAFSAATTRRSSRASKRRQGVSDGRAAKESTTRDSMVSVSMRPDSLSDGWGLMKIGLRTESGFSKKAEVIKLEPVKCHDFKMNRLIGDDGKLLRRPFEDAAPSDSATLKGKAHGAEGETASTETSAGVPERLYKTPAPTTDNSPNDRGFKATLTKVTEKSMLGKEQQEAPPSEWLQNVLRSWNNPVFETAQPPLPQINDEAPARTQVLGMNNWRHQCRADDNGGVRFEAACMSLHGRVSRSALSKAEVISQVDRKFILLRLPLRSLNAGEEASSSSALVMLDQHAADERCRLEQLMARYFKEDADTGLLNAIVEALERPQRFDVSVREGALLQQYQGHLEAWGIIYRLQPQATPGSIKQDRDAYKVIVTGLPPSILERCRGEPRLVIELMRKEIWKLNDEGFAPPQLRSAGKVPGRACTANFHGCPGGILELLHSRSCRSAIMFNDVLSQEECEQLVRRLVRCAFPFQCAHGRPSMVPLLDLGSGGRIRGWDEGRGKEGGIGAWKRWMER